MKKKLLIILSIILIFCLSVGVYVASASPKEKVLEKLNDMTLGLNTS